MSAINVFAWLYLGLVLSCELAVLLVNINITKKVSDLHEKASKPAYPLGKYDATIIVSIYIYCYSIEVKAYRKGYNNLYNDILEWYRDYTIDNKHYILDGIEEAHTTFLMVLEEARNNNTQPKFKIDESYDYHVLPKSLMYNDYVDMDKLISVVDSNIGGE